MFAIGPTASIQALVCGSLVVVEALAFVSGMLFAAKLAFPGLLNLLKTLVVMAWKTGEKWNQSLVKEAAPPPLAIVGNFEHLLATCPSEDLFFSGRRATDGFAGLRWSGPQRLDLSSVLVEADSLHGVCWQTKSRQRGVA